MKALNVLIKLASSITALFPGGFSKSLISNKKSPGNEVSLIIDRALGSSAIIFTL